MENTIPNPSILSSAMALFDAGQYDEVLTLASGTTDPALMLLAARSYLATGKYEIAETLLRSLISIMPSSSYLHSYLGEVLRKAGKDGATEEFAKALLIDTDNKSAVRNYAELLIKADDIRGAIPAFRFLVRADGKPEDVELLERLLTKVGEPEEAVNIHNQYLGEETINISYIETLFEAGEYQSSLNLALKGWRKTGDTAYLRLDLEALAKLDPVAAEKAYKSALDNFEDEKIDDENVTSIRFSYVLLEKLLGNYAIAKSEMEQFLTPDSDIFYHLIAAELESRLGNGEKANSIYRTLLSRILSAEIIDWDNAATVIDRFNAFLSAVHTKEEVAGIISVVLSPYHSAVSLAKIGEAYENAGSVIQAKDWFYRSYREDPIDGGLSYAGFLKRGGAVRDAETVVRYVFSTASTITEIEHAATEILNGNAELYRIDKCRELVQKKLAKNTDKLTSAGREMLASLYLFSATSALEERDYEACKWYCLSGIDVLPCYPEKLHLQDFMDLLVRAKGRSLYERPVLIEKIPVSSQDDDEEEDEEENNALLPDLDEREKKIISFLKEHKEATEMDLRSVLETRRVTGIVNNLIEKTQKLGVTLIEKRGMSDRGEVYGYVGRE